MDKSDWIWMPHAAHFILGTECQFHLATYVNGYLISTVGELWPDSRIRAITANAKGIQINGRGDAWDADYMKKIGYAEIGYQRKYETMVFMAEPNYEHRCCPWRMANASEIDGQGYNDPSDATDGHLALCERYATKEAPANA